MRGDWKTQDLRARAVALLPIVAVIALAVAGRLVYGRGLLGYDSVAALLWGNDIAHLRVPDFLSPFAPTPHPLFYLGLVPVSLLGPLRAAVVVEAVGWLSFGFLGYAAFRLGRALFSVPVAIAFAALLLTRPLLVGEVQRAFVDIPALALTLLAAALEAERPRRGLAPLVLLTFAGLLRPECWLLALAYSLWCGTGRERWERLRLLAMAAAAPVIWALCDLVIAGDPLHSLTGTRDLAERLGRVRGLGNAFRVLPSYLSQTVGGPVAALGIAGGLVALYVLYRRSLLPGALLVLGLGGFLALGVGGLPLLRRYLFPAGSILALFTAVALLGWWSLERGTALRRGWAIASVAVAAVLAASLPGLVRDLSATRRGSDDLGVVQRAGAELMARPQVRALAGRCPRLAVPDPELGPQLALSTGLPLSRIRTDLAPRGGSLFITALDERARHYYLYEDRFFVYDAGSLTGFQPVAANDLWKVWEHC